MWIDSLKGLPLPIGILVVFTVCMIGILRSVFRRVVDPLTKSHNETAETLRKGLDANTEAVKESVKHSETIITNHLSGQAQRDELMLAEMRGVATAVERMNYRHRSTDNLDGVDKESQK